MNFSELNLHDDLMKGIAKAGYITCTPVQEQVLTGALEGADLYVQSQTGTGKTAAFLITTIQQMLVNPKMTGKKALVMVPTRELAVQVEEEARILLSGTNLKSGSFYGGVGYTRQTAMLKKGVNILIGTPGRVLDLHESSVMDLSDVSFLVVDEADRMFDMGFYPDLRRLIKVLPATSQRQTMLFSATLNTYVKNLAWEYTTNAHEINIEAENVTVDEVDQVLLHIASDDKVKLLLGILKNEKPESVLVFCNTKRSCEVIAKRLKMNGIECEFIIGDLPQSKRLQVLDSFKRGSLTCMVATDVAARGIDVDDLSMVINFDLPNESENYVHRIGRTARAGKSGKAYTFCSEQDVYSLPAIERYIGHSIPSTVPGEDKFAEDKSANVYIQTTNYHEDRDARGSGGRSGGYRASGERSNTGRGRGYERSDSSSAGRGSYGSSDSSSSGRGRYGNSDSSSAGRGRYGNSDSSSAGRGPYGNSDSSSTERGRPGGSTSERSMRDNKNERGKYNNKDGQIELIDYNKPLASPMDRTASGHSKRPEHGGKKGAPRGKNFNQDKKQSAIEPNMANLSFDERMELYRKKYGADSAPTTVQQSGGKHKNNKKRDPKNTEQNNRSSYNSRNGTDSKFQGKKDFEHKRKNNSDGHNAQTSQKTNPTTTKATPPPKKGFFSNVKKLFGKKKG